MLKSAFEKMLNNILQYDTEAQHHLESLEGECFSIEFTDWNCVVLFTVHAKKIHIAFFSSTKGQAHLSGATRDLIKLFLSPKSGSVAAFENHLQIEGNLKVAEQFQTLFKALDIDWEEALSQYIGDAPSYYLGKGITRLNSFAKKMSKKFQSDVHDYLTEEARLLPTKTESEYFFSEIYNLHLNVERLEAKVLKCKGYIYPFHSQDAN